MKVSKVKKKPGLSYEERKKANEAMSDSFKPEVSEDSGEDFWKTLKDKVMGKSLKDTMKDNQKKKLKKMKNK
jgi:hypothetical protein